MEAHLRLDPQLRTLYTMLAFEYAQSFAYARLIVMLVPKHQRAEQLKSSLIRTFG